MMETSAIEQNGTVLVSVSGSIDAFTASDFTRFLEKCLAENKNRLVIDLSQVEYMSSAGLRSILAALKESRNHGGDLRLAGAQPGVTKVLSMSGFTQILNAYTTIDEALASFSK